MRYRNSSAALGQEEYQSRQILLAGSTMWHYGSRRRQQYLARIRKDWVRPNCRASCRRFQKPVFVRINHNPTLQQYALVCNMHARAGREHVHPLSTRNIHHGRKFAFRGKALTAYSFQLWLCRIRQLLSSPRLSPLKAVSLPTLVPKEGRIPSERHS